MNFTLKQLQYLVAIADQANITRAAEKCHVTQSTLSAAMRHLEQKFGSQLLIRHHARGISLTPQGKLLVSRARALLNHADEVSRVLTTKPGETSGTLRFGCFTTMAPFVVPPLLNLIRDTYPGLNIDVTEGNLSELQQQLKSAQLDIALIYGLNVDPDIHMEVIAGIAAHAIIGPGHPLAGQASLHLSQLEHEPMVMLDLPHSREYFSLLCARAGIRPRISYRTANFEMVRSMVGQNLGYSILNLKPHSRHAYNGSEVVCVALQEAEALPVALAWPSNLRRTQRAETLCGEIRQNIDLWLTPVPAVQA